MLVRRKSATVRTNMTATRSVISKINATLKTNTTLKTNATLKTSVTLKINAISNATGSMIVFPLISCGYSSEISSTVENVFLNGNIM